MCRLRLGSFSESDAIHFTVAPLACELIDTKSSHAWRSAYLPPADSRIVAAAARDAIDALEPVGHWIVYSSKWLGAPVVGTGRVMSGIVPVTLLVVVLVLGVLAATTSLGVVRLEARHPPTGQ